MLNDILLLPLLMQQIILDIVNSLLYERNEPAFRATAKVNSGETDSLSTIATFVTINFFLNKANLYRVYYVQIDLNFSCMSTCHIQLNM